MNSPLSPRDVDFPIADFQKLGNGILPRFDAIREYDPIYWSEINQCWFVTGHKEIGEGAAPERTELSCDRLVPVTLGRIPEADRARLYPTIAHYMPNWIINFDPPVHTRLRKLVIASLNSRVLNALTPFITERIEFVLDKIEKNPEIEFNEEVARELTGSVILRLIGLPQENLKRLRTWANALLEAAGNPAATDASMRNMENAMREMNEVLMAEIEKRRTDPKNDLLTAMTNALVDGDRLSIDEMLGTLHIAVIAGHDSTMNSLSLGVAALAQHPDFWDYMYRNPDDVPNCVLELMRYTGMSTSQSRFVVKDFDWHGHQIKTGQVVHMMLIAGNRDPRVFPNPERLDPKRPNLDQTVTFNPGLHHCLGHALAKLQLGAFFGGLVRRFEGAEVLDRELAFLPGMVFRGVYHLNMRFKPRAR